MSDIDPKPHFPPRPTTLAQELLRPVIQPGDLVIDATAGNGYDTAFLAECVGATGRVLAFDIQEAALASAKSRVTAAPWVEFFLESHVGIGSRVDEGAASVVMFNLGYLPGENHHLTTEAEETLAALNIAASRLKPGGVLSVICYPGHPAGAEEAIEVEVWMNSQAGNAWRVARYGTVGTRRPAPVLWLAAKVV